MATGTKNKRARLLPHAKVFTIHGHQLVLYPIRTLADECGKSAITLRKWEQKGVLPSAPFRDGSNNRLYSFEHIALVQHLIGKHNLMTGVHFRKTNFAKDALSGFRKLTIEQLAKSSKEVLDNGSKESTAR